MAKEKTVNKMLRSLPLLKDSQTIRDRMYAIIFYHTFMLLNRKVHKTWAPDSQFFYCFSSPQTTTWHVQSSTTLRSHSTHLANVPQTLMALKKVSLLMKSTQV